MKLISKDEFRQRHLEGWTKALRQLKPADIEEGDLPVPEYYGMAVRAAVVSGWFSDCDDPLEIAELKPGEVNKLGRSVWKLYKEFEQAGRDPN